MQNEEWILRLMDRQKFGGDGRLQSMLDEVGIRYGLREDPRELQDEELELFAAGDPAYGRRRNTGTGNPQEEDRTDDG